MSNKRWGMWLGAIRDGFVSLLPLTFFRVGAELILQLPFSAYQNWMTQQFGSNWASYLGAIVHGSNHVFSLSLAVLVAVHLASALPKKALDAEHLPSLTAGLTALINFILLMHLFDSQIESFAVQALFLAVIAGLVSAEILHWVSRWHWLERLHMPYDTDATFFYAVRSCVPVIIVTATIYLAGSLCANLLPNEDDFSAPLLAWSQNHGHGMWWLSTAATLINQLFWSVGFHGGLMLDANFGNVFAPVGAPFSTDLAWRPVFDNFVLIGGAGATLGLLIAILRVTKTGTQRQLARISVIPSLFNINDILLYGLPIVLNPLYLLPFILVPLLLTLITLGAVEIGFIQFVNNPVSWTTPPLISGWMLTNSWHGAALQILSIAISAAIYMPFVKRAEQVRKHKHQQVFSEVTKFILSENESRLSALQMQGKIGIVARSLLADFRDDFSLGKLTLAYQPKHDAHGNLLGVEALLRWKNQRHGMLRPDIAVTLAEDSGDIHALGLWVLREACACKARWNTLGYKNITMALNVSAEQLKNANLPKLIMQTLHEFSLDINEIELEITESSAIAEDNLVDNTLRELADLGVRLALDDFGMGYSSLLYLQRIRVHTIKIDGSLTRDILTNQTNSDIVHTITSLGSAQKVDVVAEFVQEEKQMLALKALGCNVFQGSLFSMPLDEAACLGYFNQQNLKSVN